MDTREVSEGKSPRGPRLRDQNVGRIPSVVRRLSLAAAAAAAIVLAPKVARAGTPFDEAVNGTPGPFREAARAQLAPGPAVDRFDMLYSTRGDESLDFSRVRFRAEEVSGEEEPGGGVIFKRLGGVDRMAVSSPDPGIPDSIVLAFLRPDGREDTVRLPGINPDGTSSGGFDMNGVQRWSEDDSCVNGGVTFLHPSAHNPRELKIAVNMPVPAWGTLDEDIYRVSIDTPATNFCADIADRIAAAAAAIPSQDPCAAGILQCNAESYPGNRELRAPETPEFEIVNMGSNHMLKWDSATNQYDIYMERGDDGCYVEELGPPYGGPPPNFDEGLGLPDALLTQPLNLGGRLIYPYVSEAPGANGRPQLEAMAFEMNADGNPCEIPVTMDWDDEVEVDDDGDGMNNDVDNCAWVQESEGINVSGPAGVADSIGDACQTTCANWPAVNPPADSTSSDFWECAGGTEISGYSHAYVRGDGSRLFTNFELPDDEFVDGALDLPAGGAFYWLHAEAAQFEGDEVPSPEFHFPPGSSADIEVLSLTHPNGDPGDATFTHLPYPPGSAEVTSSLEIDTHHFEPGLGDALGLSASVVRGHAGDENLCLECAPGCSAEWPSVSEGCDGVVDDNCNGVVNEGCPCTVGLGICVAPGVINEVGDCAGESDVDPTEETCNGLDDNCNGSTDEDIAPSACLSDCGPGTAVCVGGVWDCDAPDPQPEENCDNGIDDNCNGSTNEGCPCSVSDGECERSGTIQLDGSCGIEPGGEPCSRDGGPGNDDGGTGEDAGGMDDGGPGDDSGDGPGGPDAHVEGVDGGRGGMDADSESPNDHPGGGCHCAMHGSPERGKSTPFSPGAGLLVAGLVLLRRVRRRVTQTLER